MKNIRIFHLKIFIFLVVKFSVYLNRHVFVMPVNPSFTIEKWSLRGSNLYRNVFVMV